MKFRWNGVEPDARSVVKGKEIRCNGKEPEVDFRWLKSVRVFSWNFHLSSVPLLMAEEPVHIHSVKENPLVISVSKFS